MYGNEMETRNDVEGVQQELGGMVQLCVSGQYRGHRDMATGLRKTH